MKFLLLFSLYFLCSCSSLDYYVHSVGDKLIDTYNCEVLFKDGYKGHVNTYDSNECSFLKKKIVKRSVKSLYPNLSIKSCSGLLENPLSYSKEVIIEKEEGLCPIFL